MTILGLQEDKEALQELKTADNLTDEQISADFDVSTPEEIKNIREMLWRRDNETPMRCDYYYDIYLPEKEKNENPADI